MGLPGAGRAKAGSPSCVLTPGTDRYPLSQNPLGSIFCPVHTVSPYFHLYPEWTLGLVLVGSANPESSHRVCIDACSHPLTSQGL